MQNKQGYLQFIAIVCCLGEAAGAAVAVAHKSGSSVKDADISEIQTILRANGAFIG